MDINLVCYIPSIDATHANSSQYWTNEMGVNTHGACYSDKWIQLISGVSVKIWTLYTAFQHECEKDYPPQEHRLRQIMFLYVDRYIQLARKSVYV